MRETDELLQSSDSNTHVTKNLHLLAGSITGLEKSLEILRERLDCILLPEAPQSAEKQVGTVRNSPLAAEIGDQFDRVLALNSFVQSVTGRVDI